MTQHQMRPYDERLANGQAVPHPAGEQQGARHDMNAQHQALQVLTMAQRTAEEHLDGAKREAEQIRAGAHAEASQIVSKAQAHADALHDEAEKIIAEARAQAESIAQAAEAFAGDTERNANEVLAEAQSRAEKIVQQARASAHEIKQRAEQIYEDVVGGLTAKRQALQQQIEALERFDHEYRSRLTAFMQQQMRALWVSQPQVEADIEEGEAVPGELMPAPRTGEHDAEAQQPQD
jgi:cell division septum initiation protein DivIVA